MNIPLEPAIIRRFQLPDIDRHARWLMPRMLQAYPHLDGRGVLGFVNGLIYSNEYLFLYQPHSVALAQMMSAHTLSPKAVVWERFVWVEDRDDKTQIEEAAGFYDEMHRWAKATGCETIIVEEATDVPHETIKQHLGRIFTRQQQFARV